MTTPGWMTDNVIVSVCSMIGGAASAMLAARVKRAISRDESLLKGYDQFTTRLSTRIDALEKELDRRDQECRQRLNEANDRLDVTETRLRACESGRAELRRRIDDLARRMPGGWPTFPLDESEG